jgi:sulfatase modifying factor 1
MNGFEDAQALSLKGFVMDSEAWASESTDYVSLSKYSIHQLLRLVINHEITGDALALFLRAAALKREHVGASRFIFWSFADKPQKQDVAESRYMRCRRPSPEYEGSLHGIGAPTGEVFKSWLDERRSGDSLEAPTWSLPLLADYADEFLHLSNHLKSLSREFDSTFPIGGGKEANLMAEALDAIVYFRQAQALTLLATNVLQHAAAEHREDSVDLLVQALERIGLATRRTQRSKDIEISWDSTTSKNLIKDRENGLIRSRKGGCELVLVPGGRFEMGSELGPSDERPVHEVHVPAFYLGRYPVTNEEYARFLEENPGTKEPAYWADRRFNQPRQPVVGVSWNDAKTFAEWAGGRLTTEAEWEYAARSGGKKEEWAGTSEESALGDYAWYSANSGDKTDPVGKKKPNGLGLYDMTGNVWEWVEDCWHESYEGAPADGSAWLEAGGGNCGRRVLRGGSWFNKPRYVRAAYRAGDDAVNRNCNLGFRLAQDARAALAEPGAASSV